MFPYRPLWRCTNPISKGSFSMLCRILFFAAVSALTAFAQEFRAGILVNVQDSTGAAVDGCDIKATNTETNVATASTSSGSGNYSISFLSPGTYRMDVTCKGFRAY